MQTQERQPNPTNDGGPAPRATWWACYPIHPYRGWLLRTLWKEIPTTYLEEMVLPLHLSNNKSSTHRSWTVIGHQVMSSCSDKIHRTTWLPKYHHQRQRNKLRWSSQGTESILGRVGQNQDSKSLSTEKDRLEIQPTWSATLYWNLGKIGSKLLKGHDCNLGQPNPHRRGTQHNNVSCRANSQRKTPDSSKWRPRGSDSPCTQSLPARTRKCKCTIYAIQLTLPWPGKNFKNGSSICRHDLEKMDSWISSTMEPEIEVVKRTCAKPERRRFSVASRWLCGTLWVQTWTNNWDLHWKRRSCEISESQNGTWRAKPASREVSASILRWCFRDRKQGRRCWRHFKSAKKPPEFKK